MKELERTITAYHESGHALAAKFLSPENTVAKITIIPSSKGAGGFCINIPPDKIYHTKQEIENQIKINFAGRAAEEIVFGADNITTGASNDIEKSISLTKDYITKFGMGSSF
ncbi:MAG: cell division protein FtsH, partial [Clostridiales bacterium]|nr:cell division protein FtsH [Clostridiales bacterium]